MVYKNKKQFNNKKLLIVVTLALILVMFILYLYNNDRQENNVQDSTSNQDINNTSPSESELNAGNTQKDELLDKDKSSKPQPTSESAGKQQVNVLITDAGQYESSIEVRSFVPNYFEDGICIITFNKDSLSFQKEVPAFRDSSTTICTNPQLDRSEFSEPGEWKVTVAYESKTAYGESSISNLNIE